MAGTVLVQESTRICAGEDLEYEMIALTSCISLSS